MNQEWHITVEGDPIKWWEWCTRERIKPLWIELNNFERQLMCAITPADLERDEAVIEGFEEDIARHFKIVRVKHEVQPEDPRFAQILGFGQVQYYECHAKINGIFEPDWPMASRDLYRAARWYITRRQTTPFDPNHFAYHVRKGLRSTSRLESFEYEACVRDTNPSLDQHWS